MGRLIQRDYSNVSFFDYYYRNNTAERNPNDVKSTDSGRVVYGGGGISPPTRRSMPPKLDAFRDRTAGEVCAFQLYATFRYYAQAEAAG